MSDSRFKVEEGLIVVGNSALNNTEFYHTVKMYANLTVNADMVLVTGNLTIVGNLLYSNTSIAGDFAPVNDKASLGNTTNRFNASLFDVTIYDALVPVSNGAVIGNANSRFSVSATTIDVSSFLNLSGNLTVNSTALIIDSTNKRFSVNSAINPTKAVTISGDSLFTGNSAFTGEVNANTLKLPNSNISTNTANINTSGQRAIDIFPKAQYSSAKYLVQIKDTTNIIQISEILIAHDGTNVFITKYGDLYNSVLGIFDVSINGANVSLLFTPASANTTNPYSLSLQRTNLF